MRAAKRRKLPDQTAIATQGGEQQQPTLFETFYQAQVSVMEREREREKKEEDTHAHATLKSHLVSAGCGCSV